MDKNTACRLAGSSRNKKNRTAKRNAAFEKYKAENPNVNSRSVTKISSALQTISQVCDDNSRISPVSAQKSYDELVKLGLVKYIIPSNTPTTPLAQASPVVNTPVNQANQAIQANQLNQSIPAIQANQASQANQAIQPVIPKLKNLYEKISTLSIDLQNFISTMEKQTGGKGKRNTKRRTHRRKH